VKSELAWTSRIIGSTELYGDHCSQKQEKVDLLANTLDNRRNCRHIHVLDSKTQFQSSAREDRGLHPNACDDGAASASHTDASLSFHKPLYLSGARQSHAANTNCSPGHWHLVTCSRG